MKRLFAVLALVGAVFIGMRYIETFVPIMPVVGTSMQPTLKLGDLILVRHVDPDKVKEGDIVVFNVPGPIRDKYNYPATVAHRVTKVTGSGAAISFRTKGDNTAEEPFTVLSSDLRGQVARQIPYGGYPLVFLQSSQGKNFLIIALILLSLYFYGGDIRRGGQKLQRKLFAPIVDANIKITQRQDEAMGASASSLQQFAEAVSEYAKHLASHTAAIQELAAASKELREITREQREMFASWRETETHITHVPQPAASIQQSADALDEICDLTVEREDRKESDEGGIDGYFTDTGETVQDASGPSTSLPDVADKS